MYTLSICIPTYNRKQLLKETLESIIPQVTDEVEVVVSYTDSADGTEEMMAEYVKKYNFIFFFRAGANQGADRAFLKAVEPVKGKYIWFFSDDDLMEAGGVDRVLSEIKSNPDIDTFQIGHVFLGSGKKHVIYWKTFGSYDRDTVYDSADSFLKGERIAYSGYLPALVIKKQKWNAYAKSAEEFIGTAYVHMFILFCVMRDGGKIKCISPHYILNRPDNDYFTDRSQSVEKRLFRRRALDITSYDKISAAVFGKGSQINYRANMSVIRFFVAPEIIISKAKGVGNEYFDNVRRLAFQHYSSYPVFWLFLLPLLFIPAPIVMVARKLKRAM
jgi:abequosyltransferase